MTESAPQTHQDSILTAFGPEGLSVDPSAILASHTLRPCRDPECALPNHRHCRRCLDAWQGDPDTGGCTARLLAQELARLQPELDGYMRTAASNYQRVRATEARVALVEAGAEQSESVASGFRLLRDAAEARVERLEGLLREVEWGGEVRASPDAIVRLCLFCYATTGEGHTSDCRLMVALDREP